jgi:lambda family phage tail tape measure protein
MAMNMDALLRIKADVQGENNIRRLGNSMQGLQGQVKNAQLSFNNLKTSVSGFASAIAGTAIVGGLAAVVKQSIDAGDALNRMQMITGISARSLTGIANEAKLADVDMGTLTKGLTKLNVNIAKAANGNKDLAQKFKDLGISIKDSKGNVEPTDAILKKLATRFADMPDGAQKAAAAVALFGKAGAELIPMLNDGGAAMEKFTYKVSDDFAARSDLFNDTVTTLGIRTKGFGLELTDALLPSLQSILEVFGELFDSKQDWKALFDVILFGVRGVATVLLAMVKLVDEAVRLIGSFAKRAQLAFKGDFAGATAEANRFGGDFMQRFQGNVKQFQSLWSESASPGTGLRTGGRDVQNTDLAGQKAAASAAEAAARKANQEQERHNELVKRGSNMLQDLKDKQADLNREILGVGMSGGAKAFQEWSDSMEKSMVGFRDMGKQLKEFKSDLAAKGGQLDTRTLTEWTDAIIGITNGQQGLALSKFNNDMQDMFRTQTEGFQEAAKAAAEHSRVLRDNGDAMLGLREGFNAYVDQLGTMREAASSLATDGLNKVGDSIIELATTGAVNFKAFALDIIKMTMRMIIQQFVLKAIMSALGFAGSSSGGSGVPGISGDFYKSMPIGNFTPSANGNVFGANGIVPFAMGGVVSRPTIFPFAKGVGLMGEAGPEAILPLQRGANGKLGVAGGGQSTTINVSVDAKGSSVQGDGGKGNQLARVIAAAVQDEMIKQKRPGGILAA